MVIKKDVFSNILRNKKDLVEEYNIYIIDPNVENFIILKNITSDIIEFIMDSVLLVLR